MPTWMSVSFQDSSTPVMEQLIYFHDELMMVLTLITVLTAYMLLSSIMNKSFNKFSLEDQKIETAWTFLPMVFLIYIAFPSLYILSWMEEMKNHEMTMKVLGHQWYWSYEYSDLEETEMDSFMEDKGTVRLLEVNKDLIIPTHTHTRLIISSTDVIHSWAMPSMGIKVDAMPGRLNQTFLFLERVGIFSGQCSEICGANHSFMPITLKSLSMKEFFENLE